MTRSALLSLIFFTCFASFGPLSRCLAQQSCNNWLHLPSQPSYVNIGDLDVSGTTITVEASFNTILNNNGFGDLVAKHQGSADVNYLLRAYSGEITTSNGYFRAITFCPVEPNKIYHAAMVYNGSSLKFYRNGFLMAEVPATGTLFQNNWQTWIGYYQPQALPENFIGYINEVRIWNTARSQAEIIANMTTSLSSPTTQPGLLAYYTFDNLINKQGNPTWNGALGGSASINGTSSACEFYRDSCDVFQGAISGIINSYTPVTGFDICKNIITVEDATDFNVGDTVLMIQMKGAAIDSTNTPSFGTVNNYENAGNYEFNFVKSKSGNEIELLNTVLKTYDIPDGLVQLVRVPYYQKAIINAPLTCAPWDGRKGGVLVLNSQDSVILYSNIDVSGKGFRGGLDPVTNPSSAFCNESQYFYPPNPDLASQKGEGIAIISDAKSFGRGALANGGGGGNSHNSGGGGGGNIAAGGLGGYQYEGVPCNGTVPFDNRGLGGKPLTYSNATHKIFMGGGGGAGQSNNVEGFQSTGGAGSGIVIVIADKLKSNGYKIIANGNAANPCPGGGIGCHEAMGGGGAGGTALLNVNTYVDNANIETRGGNGGDMTAAGLLRIGPGGGGGGGIQWYSSPALPGNVTANNNGGQNGVATAYGNDPWGATAGSAGSNLFNLQLAYATIPFRSNIDSVRIRDTAAGCNIIDFDGLAFTNTHPIASWEWLFGDGGTASTQNVLYAYASSGTYTVKLIVTDINGCRDSISIDIEAVCANPIGTVINDYTPVTGFDICKNILSVEDASSFNVGDTVLIIQMKGAAIDSTNSSSFGTITNLHSSGNYEFNYVRVKTGNDIELLNTVTKSFDVPNGRVQLVRVPYFTTVNVTTTLTCLPWDGRKGGILVLNVRDTVHLNTNIDVSGKGFRGGLDPVSNPSPFFCNENQYYYPPNPDLASQKGEGIAEVSDTKSFGRGALGNGGGGGNSHNSGGGGGSNIATGGLGGYQYEGAPCNVTIPFDNRGMGGKAITYSNASNKIFMGGGGGAGQSNNVEGFQATGGAGSGIVIIIADKLKSNGHKIVVNGNAANPCPGGGTGCHEGMGGGGAGGTALLNVNSFIDNVNIETRGGNGGSMTTAGFLKVGPGGGGGGGIQWFSTSALPGNVTSNNNGGQNGVAIGYANDPWGASPGAAGSNLFNLQLPFATTPFKPNIDSVRIKDSITACKSFDFKGQGYTNTHAVSSWEWFFGDGGTANVQNTSHSYGSAGTYTVKLVITDINGCKDSISKNVTAIDVFADAGLADTICSPNSTVLQATQTGGNSISWSPAAYLDNPNSLSPVATPPSTTMFYFTVTAFNGCEETDSVEIVVRTAASFSIAAPSPACELDSTQLLASGGDIYLWSPATGLSDPNIPNPLASPSGTTLYSVQITDTLCNRTETLSTNVIIYPLPGIDAQKSNDISCSTNESQLTATGGVTYAWTPAATLNNPSISNPVATPLVATQYYVTGTDANGCSNRDSVLVEVDMASTAKFLLPSAFTPNGDGLNDCFGTKYWGTILEIEFSVYNRWGQRIFYTRSPDKCWDGTYGGKKQPPGVYVYWIRAKTSCIEEVFRKGTITLIR